MHEENIGGSPELHGEVEFVDRVNVNKGKTDQGKVSGADQKNVTSGAAENLERPETREKNDIGKTATQERPDTEKTPLV